MATAMLAPILTLMLLLLPARAAQWPEWSLPAPLPRPERQDLIYPAWFAGRWQVSSGAISFEARFCQRPEVMGKQPHVCQSPDPGKPPELGQPGRGERAVVGDRAFNALSIGKAVLGEQLLSVRSDPANPNRQIALLADRQELESQVVGRRSETPPITESSTAAGGSTAAGSSTAGSTAAADPTAAGRSTAGSTAPEFWADELSLQVLHGPGEPRLSRVETLSHFVLQADGSIQGEQWQASYPSPSLGLAARATSTNHELLKLDPISLDPFRLDPISLDPFRLDPPGRQSDPAS
jgi:hypothetical protein